MDKIIEECQQIKEYYETNFVNMSVIICNDPMFIQYLREFLLKDDFPIELVHHLNFMEVLEKFLNGRLRMLLMSDLMFEAICNYHKNLFQDVSAIFLSSKSFANIDYYKSCHGRYNFISL